MVQGHMNMVDGWPQSCPESPECLTIVAE